MPALLGPLVPGRHLTPPLPSQLGRFRAQEPTPWNSAGGLCIRTWHKLNLYSRWVESVTAWVASRGMCPCVLGHSPPFALCLPPATAPPTPWLISLSHNYMHCRVSSCAFLFQTRIEQLLCVCSGRWGSSGEHLWADFPYSHCYSLVASVTVVIFAFNLELNVVLPSTLTGQLEIWA